jgi:hypothetical protein
MIVAKIFVFVEKSRARIAVKCYVFVHHPFAVSVVNPPAFVNPPKNHHALLVATLHVDVTLPRK